MIADTIGMFEDIDGTLRLVNHLCAPSTRIVISYYSHLWEPILKLAEALHLRARQPKINYIATADFKNLMDIADFEVLSQEQRQLLPRRWLGLGPFINRFIAPLPGIRQLCLRTYLVGRPVRLFPERKFSVSILIPCRNEKGNIENAILRMPKFGSAQEILFVEGNSSDGTFEECERVRDAYRDSWDIKVLKQDGKGKGDAVRKGFAAATGDVLMILDADLTMPPEALPKYHAVIETGKAEFVNGTRLIYPMEHEAMRPLNLIANRCFAYLFSYLVNTRLTDTLCGTKVLLRKDYEVLARERDYFGNFDPFGDFDLIFGAAKQNLKIIETPIHYKARTFGETQISRFRDGWLLLKMVWFAYRKLEGDLSSRLRSQPLDRHWSHGAKQPESVLRRSMDCRGAGSLRAPMLRSDATTNNVASYSSPASCEVSATRIVAFLNSRFNGAGGHSKPTRPSTLHSRRTLVRDAAQCWPSRSSTFALQSWGLTAHGLFILQCSNYLFLVELKKSLAKELPVSLANNVEFLRRLPKLNGINGFGDFGRNLRPGLAAPWLKPPDLGPIRAISGCSRLCRANSSSRAGPCRRSARMRPDRRRLRSGRRLVHAGEALWFRAADARAAAIE